MRGGHCWASQVPRSALKTPFRGGTLQDVAKQVRQPVIACTHDLHRPRCSRLSGLTACTSASATPARTRSVATGRDESHFYHLVPPL